MFRRLVAYGIDWYIVTILMNVLVLAVAYAQTGALWAGPLPLAFFDPGVQPAVLAALALIEVAYYCLVPLRVFPGQTLGKRLLGLKMVGRDGGRPGLARLLVRDLLGIVLLEGCFSPLSNYVRNYLMLFLPEDVIRYTVWFSWAVGVLSILMLVFSKRRMLHDLVAGTAVEVVAAASVSVDGTADGAAAAPSVAAADGSAAGSAAADGRVAACGPCGSRQSADI